MGGPSVIGPRRRCDGRLTGPGVSASPCAGNCAFCTENRLRSRVVKESRWTFGCFGLACVRLSQLSFSVSGCCCQRLGTLRGGESDHAFKACNSSAESNRPTWRLKNGVAKWKGRGRIVLLRAASGGPPGRRGTQERSGVATSPGLKGRAYEK